MAWGGWVVVPTFNVDVALGPMRDGMIEPWTTRMVQEFLRPGSRYFNAGANFGYYTSLGSRLVGQSGKVYAVEPNPYIAPFLLHTMYWSGATANTTVYLRALGTSAGDTLLFSFDPQYLGGGAGREPGHAGRTLPFEQCLWSAEAVTRLVDESGVLRPTRSLYTSFECKTITIDSIVPDNETIDLLHLDIEGAEPLALVGGLDVIRRSKQLKMITEWTCEHYQKGSPYVRECWDRFWTVAAELGYRPRWLEPRLADTGGVFLSAPLSYEYMVQSAIHGDYVWVRQDSDPW